MHKIIVKLIDNKKKFFLIKKNTTEEIPFLEKYGNYIWIKYFFDNCVLFVGENKNMTYVDYINLTQPSVEISNKDVEVEIINNTMVSQNEVICAVTVSSKKLAYLKFNPNENRK